MKRLRALRHQFEYWTHLNPMEAAFRAALVGLFVCGCGMLWTR